MYAAVVWAEVMFGSAILLSGMSQPLVLLVISAALNGLVMFIYSALLIKLNAGVLPRTIELRGCRLTVMWGRSSSSAASRCSPTWIRGGGCSVAASAGGDLQRVDQ